MTPDVWYVAGKGLLVGADRRWLLLDDVPDEAFVATLWETIAGSGVDRVLTLLESRYGDNLPSLAMIGSGREIARGNRVKGMAASQARIVHEGLSYDVEVDTTHTESLACARVIAAHVTRVSSPPT